ncbi:septum site-determining protein MinC [Legionella sp. W05-934-2]|uniref:septum site-determining protein MinC n=1 Tax=Legionella sp. W05-934-2 TaxID=1198649 RepID=UPI003461F0D7
MNQSSTQTKAFHLKGRMFTLTVMQFHYDNFPSLEEQLEEAIAQAPAMFEQTGIVLDFSKMGNKELNLSQLCDTMLSKGLYPVAVQSPHPEHAAMAISQGLPILHASTKYDRAIEDETRKKVVETQEACVAKIHDKPVRSGQQVVSKSGDLIITAPVSHGAELLANGNIHIYGPLRGRALAGINGDINARIFCQALEADLVSIAGYYRLSDDLQDIKGPCQIYLQDEQLIVEPL